MRYRAPKAGALPGCATPRQETLFYYKAFTNVDAAQNSQFDLNCAGTQGRIERHLVCLMRRRASEHETTSTQTQARQPLQQRFDAELAGFLASAVIFHSVTEESLAL
jgi:hypothetical protein